MAENSKHKSPARSDGGKSTSTQRANRQTATSTGKSRTTTRTSTMAEKKPDTSSKKKTNSTGTRSTPKDTRRPAENRRDPAQQEAKMTRRRTFSEQFLPYVLGAVGFFLGACFVLGVIKDDLMGVVGYSINYVLFGIFGWTAYLIPLLLFNLAIFWKRYCDEGLVPIKITLSLALMILLSAVTHAGICASDADLAAVYDPGYLFRTGAKLEAGGLLGGLLGFVLYLGLRLPGTIVLAIVTLPLVVMCLIGVTPVYVFSKLWAAFRAWRARRAEIRQAREETETEAEEKEADEDESATPTESYRARRARAADEAANKAAPSPTRRTVVVEEQLVDADTGELLEESSDDTASDVNPPAPVDQGRRSRKKTEVTTEEVYKPLPIYEPTTANTSAAETIPAEPARAKATERRYGAADGALAWEDPDGDVPTLEQLADHSRSGDVTRVADANTLQLVEEEPNIVPVDINDLDENGVELDDDMNEAPAGDGSCEAEAPASDVPAVSSGPTVSYAVVQGDGTQTKVTDPVNVVIHRQETAAVMAEGLGAEEVVLPKSTLDIPVAPTKEYLFPPLDMLTRGSVRYEANDAEIAENTQKLREVLESFRIGVRDIACSCGPTITRFEVKPDSGIRVRSIVNLVDDISMGLAKGGVRIEAPIPGKSAVGIEVPNASPAMVYLRNILEAPEFRNHKSRIAACLGADVGGRPVIFDIQAMPHLLIAGATGTGKSVCINSIIMSILYKADPADVKLILIDPKKVEFAMYRDLPHLYAPVVSDPKKAAGALNSAVNEMERRFELIEEVGVRNIAGYNKITEGDPERPPLPQMVIIIDELADLMMTAPSEVETAICRLAQKARAAGIHLVVGTQRPSVDVITGLIKANIPSRIAFAVSSAVDSKIILESTGADKLIGRGDMLFSPIGANKPIRVQGAFVSEAEVEQVVTFIKEHNEKGVFNEDFTREIEVEAAKCGMGKRRAGEQMSIEECDSLGVANSGEDPKFWEALEVAVGQEKIGTSALQRKLNLGYGRAAKIIDRMEELGFVGPDPGTKQGRKVIITANELAEYRMNGLPSGGAAGEE